MRRKSGRAFGGTRGWFGQCVNGHIRWHGSTISCQSGPIGRFVSPHVTPSLCLSDTSTACVSGSVARIVRYNAPYVPEFVTSAKRRVPSNGKLNARASGFPAKAFGSALNTYGLASVSGSTSRATSAHNTSAIPSTPNPIIALFAFIRHSPSTTVTSLNLRPVL
jgi:hypothetical protein